MPVMDLFCLTESGCRMAASSFILRRNLKRVGSYYRHRFESDSESDGAQRFPLNPDLHRGHNHNPNPDPRNPRRFDGLKALSWPKGNPWLISLSKKVGPDTANDLQKRRPALSMAQSER
jgi:hypothetical protein